MFEIKNMEKYDKEIDNTLFKFIRNREYEKILGAIGRFGIYGVRNILLILSQSPNARYVNSMRGWNSIGRYVMSYSNPLRILSKQYGSPDESKKNVYSLGMAYEDKWTRHPEKHMRGEFVPISVTKNKAKYYPCFIKGVERLCHDVKDTEDIVSLKNEFFNISKLSTYEKEDVEKSLTLASKIMAKNQYLSTPAQEEQKQEEDRLAVSIEYILKERYNFEKPSVDNDFAKYSDYQLKTVALNLLYSARSLANKQSDWIGIEISLQEGRWVYQRHNRSLENEEKKKEQENNQNLGM